MSNPSNYGSPLFMSFPGYPFLHGRWKVYQTGRRARGSLLAGLLEDKPVAGCGPWAGHWIL